MLSLTPTWAIWCDRNTEKLGWNRGGLSVNYRGCIWSDYNFHMCTFLKYLRCDCECVMATPTSPFLKRRIVSSSPFLWSTGRCYVSLNLNKTAELSQRRPRDAPMGALKSFESPHYAPGYFSRNLFRSILRMCVQKLKFVALPFLR